MVENKITEYTRQDIVDLLTSGYYDKKNDKKIQYFWSGRLDEVSFLSRLYNLQQIESTDHRFKNAYGDITQHRINNWDWEDDWVFYDPRFGIKNLNDKEFLRFILEIFNPAVRDESKNWEEALEKINEFLKRDGFEIYESDNISGRQIFQYRRYSEMKIKLEFQSNKHANLHLIGEGSYALVYYYKDDFYDKKIALKRAKKDLTSKELERFKREFDELKSFKSPYIVDVYSYNAENREYTMEYMDSNLYDFIRTNNDKLTTTERKSYVYQVLKAFKYIHSKGRLHRDINPKNILIKIYDDVPVVKISDFGLIKQEESTLTTVNTDFKGWFNDPNLRIIGFDKYSMCHEIYALTMTIYYLMTGKTNTSNIHNTKLLDLVNKGMNAHSGRTNSNGGHKDNQNKSGLGSYHYHCGGHPAHLHTNGVCPYSSSSSSKSSTSNSSSSSTKTTSTVPATIVATDIKINENITEMKVEESQKLTATLIPDNVTDKNITWKSSDESIATISSSGEIIAKKSGTVEITATSSNGKTNTIKINIKEDITSKNNITNNTTITGNEKDSNPLGGVLALGLLSGVGCWGYKKYKKS